MAKIIILDNGHGRDTAGRRSPKWADGSQLFEWEFNRDIVKRITSLLQVRGLKVHILVPEDYDVSLPDRVARANKIYAKDKDAYLISVHANAGGGLGTGFEAYTSVGNTPADPLATILCEEANRHLVDFNMRFDHYDGDPDKESQFYILKNTNCPAILTENLFMDNEKDCRYLMSDEGRQKIAQLHASAILRIAML